MKEIMKQEDSCRAMLEVVVIECLNSHDTALTQIELERNLIKRVLAQIAQLTKDGITLKQPSVEQIREILDNLKSEDSTKTGMKYFYLRDEERLGRRLANNWGLINTRLKLVSKKGTASSSPRTIF